ncbi:MAG TPA: 50S ribosomal protein L23 [Acholeplasmataceae bacterium]|jgi:large subunit ribosomal protein L23|nr:50S ribosomal protein L23 [Acholeplasmataceae bacterium]
MRKFEIIKEPIITERSMQLVETNNSYTFVVDKKANKVEIKKAIEQIFNVHVVSVRTINVVPKKKRMGQYEGYTSGYKKAIVKLVDGDSIEAFAV